VFRWKIEGELTEQVVGGSLTCAIEGIRLDIALADGGKVPQNKIM
jgi:hypothetical protein